MKKKSLSAKKIIHSLPIKYLTDNKINKIFNYFKNYLKKNIGSNKKIGVAVSGGPDSLALAFLAKCYSIINKSEVLFFIVDHKIRRESSSEAKSIKLLLSKFDIYSEILKWHGKKPKSNIQGIARNKRYGLLTKACVKKKIKFLLVGHHVDDLYENFLIRLTRGSGLKGLSSFGEIIKEKDIQIHRPLIKLEKKDLVYISNNVFKFFVKDPSNFNFLFKRTRMRKLISDLKNEGFDKNKLNITIRNLQSANDAMYFYVKKNIENNAKYIEKKNTYILNKFFFVQPKEIIFRSISLILNKVSGNYYAPRGKSISEFILKINSEKFHKFTLGGCHIEKISKTILITKENHR